MEMKYLAPFVWSVVWVWIGVRLGAVLEGTPLSSVVLFIFGGLWYATIAAACLAPWIWLIWP